MADTTKDTIYIDVDDEITTVIDKVLGSDHNLVALVLPKRAAVFQSVVNMKLLKRKTDDAGKNLVLITTESSLLPLAGSVGLYVAKTLASRPEIPEAPDMNESTIEADEDEAIAIGDDEKPDIDLKSAAAAPVGALADAPEPPSKLDKDIETIELDNEAEDPASSEDEASAKSSKVKKPKKDQKLKVPNFERFRLLLVLGALVIIILIGLIWFGLSALPKATINIQTDAANVNANANFTMSTTAQTLNMSNKTVPAKQVNETKTYTATVNATGQQNNGQKASGTVAMTAEECGTFNPPNDLPAGSEITQNSFAYITQSSTTFNPVNSGKKGQCLIYSSTTSTTAVIAQQGGSAENTSGGSVPFTVPGRSDISATGTASNGTDDVVQEVSQTDITNAQNKIATNTSGAKQDLTNQLTQANYYPIAETFTAATPNISPNATAGTAASSVTVTETVAYTMYGVRQSDLKTLIDANITSQVSSNQSILNDGLSSASFTSSDGTTTSTNLTVQTTAEVGPDISVSTIKQQVAGKKSADIQAIVKNNPHVSSVTVHFSPFYVDTAPNNINKITVNIAKPTNVSSNASTNQ